MHSQVTHILYIAEFSTGGSVESLLCLVRGLDKDKFNATVLFFTLPDERQVSRFRDAGAEVESLYPYRETRTGPADIRNRNMQGRVRRVLGVRGEKLYESFKYALHFLRLRWPIYKSLRKAINKIDPDIIHLNNGLRSDTPGLLAARKHGAPTFCHVRTFSKLTHLNIAAASKVAKFICISNAVRDTIVDYGIERDRCVVVPNAVDMETFTTSDRTRTEVRSDFGFDDANFVFTLAGRVVSWKGHVDFIDAIAAARAKNESIVGLIVGDAGNSQQNNKFLASLKTQVDRLSLQGAIVFAGHRTDIADIMQASDVVVCPSSEPEPFGRVIIESMAMGTPVIATDAGGATDIIKNDVNGLLVPIKNSAALAAAMLRLREEPELARRLESAAKTDAIERYNVRNHVLEVCKIYREADAET